MLPSDRSATTGSGSVGATFQLGAKLGVSPLGRNPERDLDFADIGRVGGRDHTWRDHNTSGW